MSRALLALTLAVLLASCSRNARPAEPRASKDVLTRQEIASIQANNAYDAVQRLRPNFLRRRPSGMHSNPFAVVFIDGVRRGAPETLRTIAASLVEEIRFLSASQATTRYGLDVEGGVIDVKLVGSR